MSVTGLDNRQEMQTAATAAAKASKADGKTDAGEDASAAAGSAAPDFAALLQGRLGRNMALTRADAQLTVPERAATNDQAAAMRDGRARDPGFDGTKRDEPTPAARNEPPRETARPSRDGESAAPRPRAESAERAADAPEAPAKETAANAARDAAARTGEAPADKVAARAPVPDAAAKVAAAERQSPAADGKQQTAQTRAAGDLPAKVQVTQQPAQLSSQPQSTLGAASAVAAETARGAQAKADGPATPEEMLQTLRSGQPGAADADAAQAANKPSAANPAAQAAKAQAAAKAAAQQAQSQGAQPQAEAGAAQPQAATLPNGRSATQPGAQGLQTALDAGGRVAALTGAGKPTVAADPLTGGAALTGQNNSVSQRSAPPQAAHMARHAPTPTPVADQVAVQIQKAAQAGADKITVQLRPAELGRVEVKMEVAHDGRLTAVVTADKAETLDMLRQDARQLLQTLNDAGLKADQQSLSFNLRGQQAEGGGDGAKNGGGGRDRDADAKADLGRDPFDDVGETGGFTADGRLNLRV
ncbi:MAG: flagellar hook-length control protein FliK [Marivibrio sp.]|uniref:flagellar hook-length control protein FliK n=1 Tax=Marivibrio sp. TaxID=2039719 RepID=UPI0032EE7247